MTLRRGMDVFSEAIPLVVAAAALLLESTFSNPLELGARLTALVCLLVVPAIALLAAPGWDARTRRAIAVPALLAPLAVCFPWTAAPSAFGVGFGGFAFFLHWLTKYPNLGFLNYEVLIGLLCVLGCAFLPWLSAILTLHDRANRLARVGILGLALIAYVPVLIRLDVTLLLAGTVTRGVPLQFRPPVWVVFGPVLRLASILSMGAMLLGENRKS